MVEDLDWDKMTIAEKQDLLDDILRCIDDVYEAVELLSQSYCEISDTRKSLTKEIEKMAYGLNDVKKAMSNSWHVEVRKSLFGLRSLYDL